MGPSGYLDRHKTPDMILRYAPLLATTVIAVATAQAQISIGANEMPHAGDALRRTRAVINPFLDHATTGAAHTWDFSDLQVNTEDTADYQDVASTNIVYALVYADIFFNPNRANVATAGTDIPFSGLLPITDPYTFLYRSSSEYTKVGFGAEVSGIPVPIIFNEHDVIYELPLNYGDNTSSHSAWELSVPSLAHYGYEQDRTNDVDGWGTITTPSGTYDVLRGETTTSGVLTTSGTNAIVDWVRIELRSSGNPAILSATRHALLQRDGDVVSAADGTSNISLNVPPGDYYVAIRHRNHLGCMTAAAVPLTGSATTIDFRSSGTDTYGTNARETVGAQMALWAGNAVYDTAPPYKLKYTGTDNDRDAILTAIGGVVPTNTVIGYLISDVNMDGRAKYTGTGNDRDVILGNIGGVVPTNTRVQQLP